MTMMLRRTRTASVLAAVALAAFPGLALAQGATISGVVKSGQGQVLQAANVRIAELNVSVGTNALGEYRINVAADRVRGQAVTLSARAVGYKPQSRQVTISPGAQDQNFTLMFDVNRVSEVVVTGDRVDTVRSMSGKQLAFTIDRAGNVTYPPGANFSQHLYPPELIMQNQGRLGITEAQREAILTEINKVQATATQYQWRVADESEKLNQLLERENVPESEAMAQADRMMNSELAVKRAQLTMLIRIRNVLTAEQKAILNGLPRRR